MCTKDVALKYMSIHPGDKIMVAMRETGLEIDAMEIKTVLEERFPNVEFTIVAGVAEVGKLEL